MDMKQLENLFTYHAPQGDDTKRFVALRQKGLELAKAIALLTPVCPDQTVAIRKVREAVMTANAAIVTSSERPEFVDVLSAPEGVAAYAAQCVEVIALLREAAKEDEFLAALLKMYNVLEG
jgi:hypothetical protein